MNVSFLVGKRNTTYTDIQIKMAQDILAVLIKKPCCVGWTDKIYFGISKLYNLNVLILTDSRSLLKVICL